MNECEKSITSEKQLILSILATAACIAARSQIASAAAKEKELFTLQRQVTIWSPYKAHGKVSKLNS